MWLEAEAGPQGQPVQMYGLLYLFPVALCVHLNMDTLVSWCRRLMQQTTGLSPSRHCPAGLLGNSVSRCPRRVPGALRQG